MRLGASFVWLSMFLPPAPSSSSSSGPMIVDETVDTVAWRRAAALDAPSTISATSSLHTGTYSDSVPHAYAFTPDHAVTTVHVVSSAHLDVGYKYPYVAEVLSEWFTQWIPDSIALSEQLREADPKDGALRHRWTMSPWVASFYMCCPAEGGAQWRGDVDGTQPTFRLRCPNATMISRFKAAVARGDINFYASAFCTVYEYADPELLSWISEFVHNTGRDAGQRHVSTVASQRDEPGVTRAAIPLLVDRGVTALTMGVDWASPMADVPRAFVWRDPISGKELLVAWHNYGYGGGGNSGRDGTWPAYSNSTVVQPGNADAANMSGPNWCMTQPPAGETCNSTLSLPGLPDALALFIQNDNHGPPTIAQIKHYYTTLRQMFPNATLVSSTYEAFFEQLDKVRHTLPVIEQEIGDTWIDDPPSDPLLASQFRALMRARTRCVREQPALCNQSDNGSAFWNFSRFLIKNVEHDWGTQYGGSTWTNAALSKSLANCSIDSTSNPGCLAEISWRDQRVWGIDFALDALRSETKPPHPLLAMAEEELVHLRPMTPSTTGLRRQLDVTKVMAVASGAATVGFDSAGAISHLQTAPNNVTWATSSHLLAEPVVHVSSAAQRSSWALEYLATGPPVAGWIGRMFFKTGCPNGTGLGYRPMAEMWQSDDSGTVDTVLFRQKLPTRVVADFGGASDLWQKYTFARSRDGSTLHINITLWAFNKTRTRITESWWLRFHPFLSSDVTNSMRLDKLGSLIDPRQVLRNGSKTLHGLWRGIVYGINISDTDNLRISSPDVPVVKIGAGNASLESNASPMDGLNPAPVPNTVQPRLDQGIAFNIYNNVWATNAIQWYPFHTDDKDWTFRFSMAVPLKSDDATATHALWRTNSFDDGGLARRPPVDRVSGKLLFIDRDVLSNSSAGISLEVHPSMSA